MTMADEAAVELDFYADWIRALRSPLKAEGYNLAPSDDGGTIEILYFNVRKRRVSVRPRQLFLPRDFTPQTYVRGGVDHLLNKVQRGDDLRPHLSSRIRKPRYDDTLLNAWGIHHFHLGIDVREDEFVTRTSPLIFARVTDDEFYVAGVYDHGDWADHAVMEVLHRNWPHSLECFRLQGVRPFPSSYTTAEVLHLRENGISPTLQMADGTVYGAPGGGLTTSRRSVAVMIQVGRHRLWLRQREQYVRWYISQHRSDIERRLGRESTLYRFRLELSKGQALAIDDANGVTLELGAAPYAIC